MTRASMLAGTALAGALLALSLVTAPAARAQTAVTPEQAHALETQLRGWVASLFGPKVSLTMIPIHILPDGDHYKLEENIAGLMGSSGVTIASPPLTASIKPLDGGRWAIDNLVIPSPLNIKIAGAKPELQGDMTQTIADATMHGVLDPSLATTSSYDATMTGLSQVFKTAMGTQTTTIAKLAGNSTMTPKAGKGVTIQSDTTGEGYASSFPMKNGNPVTIAIDRIHVGATVEDFSFARMGEILHTISAIGALGEPNSPAGVALSHQMVTAVSDLLGSMDGDETLEGLHVEAAGFGGTLQKLVISSGFGAPKGKADWHMKISLDGLDSPAIPPGPYRDFLPKHFNLEPHLSGVSKATLVSLVQDAIDHPGADKQNPMAFANQLLKDGPLTVALDDISFDMGPAALTGTASVDVDSPADVTGEAEIHVKGLDALIRKVNTTPELQQGAPVLVFLKGIGEQTGDDTVWAVKYEDNKLTVNGTDMSSMIPGSKPSAK